MRILTFLPIVLALPLGGCILKTSDSSSSAPQKPPPLSSTVQTSEVWPSLSAQSDGTSLKVYAAILKSSDFVKLDTGDYFTAQIGNADPVVLTLEPYTDGKVHYSATFPASGDAADVAIAFHRATGFVSAPGSKVTVAAPFTVTSTPPATLKLGTLLTVSISPVPSTAASDNDYWSIAVTGDCIDDGGPFRVSVDSETGNAQLDTSLLKLKQGATGCDVGVQVRHETRGACDSAYNGASSHPVEGLQARVFGTALQL
jgi:hypothetical protein